MSVLSELEKVLAVVESGGAQAVHAVVVIADGAAKLTELLVKGQALAPAVAAQITTLLASAEAVATAVVAASAAKGTNWVEDSASVTAVEQFIPIVISTLKLLAADAHTLVPTVVPAEPPVAVTA